MAVNSVRCYLRLWFLGSNKVGGQGRLLGDVWRWFPGKLICMIGNIELEELWGNIFCFWVIWYDEDSRSVVWNSKHFNRKNWKIKLKLWSTSVVFLWSLDWPVSACQYFLPLLPTFMKLLGIIGTKLNRTHTSWVDLSWQSKSLFSVVKSLLQADQ